MEKYCPLKNLVITPVYGEPYLDPQYCQKEHCAWYDTKEEQCAIVTKLK